MRKVLFFILNTNTDIYYREVLASTLLLSTIIPKTFLVVLITFISLVSKRFLFLIRYISKRSVSKLIIFRVFILLLC